VLRSYNDRKLSVSLCVFFVRRLQYVANAAGVYASKKLVKSSLSRCWEDEGTEFFITQPRHCQLEIRNTAVGSHSPVGSSARQHC
jgi:hypothetical protein